LVASAVADVRVASAIAWGWQPGAIDYARGERDVVYMVWSIVWYAIRWVYVIGYGLPRAINLITLIKSMFVWVVCGWLCRESCVKKTAVQRKLLF
jgi:hypothetical protein